MVPAQPDQLGLQLPGVVGPAGRAAHSAAVAKATGALFEIDHKIPQLAGSGPLDISRTRRRMQGRSSHDRRFGDELYAREELAGRMTSVMVQAGTDHILTFSLAPGKRRAQGRGTRDL
jgi:hypothetical protein